jgi:glucose/arabinose dehydrogenase
LHFTTTRVSTRRATAYLALYLLIVIALAACQPAPTATPEVSTLPPPQVATTQQQAEPTGVTPNATPSPQPTLTVPEPAATALDPASTQAARFAVIGDYGLAGEPLARVATLVKSWEPEFIVTTGDNNYPEGAPETIDENIGQYFHAYIHPYHGAYGPGAEINRFFPALGNHDLNTADGQAYFDYFDLPGNGRYYDVVWGPVHLFILNSDWREPDGIGHSSAQANWLGAGLAESSAPWKLVVLHTPPYSSGIQGSNLAVQWPFQEWGASAILAGHDHIYERLMIDGIPYITNGLGGGPRYEFAEILPESAVRYRANHGAMLVEADEQEIVFRFYTVDNELIDEYRMANAALALPASVEQLPDPASYSWQPWISGLSSPIGLFESPVVDGRLYVIEQAGVIRTIQDGELLAEPFLDIRGRVSARANEQGLLGMAFHPNYAENGHVYLHYTDLNGNTVISRFDSGPDRADSDSEAILLGVAQPYANHNGGEIVFGPDGYLYIGLGDGGSAGDPQRNAQNTNSLLGKILRIDVEAGQPYAIPGDNPFTAGGGAPEVYLFGLRNPWKFSFDSQTGDLYIADVGQNAWEEINYLPAGNMAGANLGWDYLEGTHIYRSAPPPGLELIDPVVEYDHSQGCSVTGGVVYRGERWQDFNGVYLYGDFCSGRIWGLLQTPEGGWQNAQLFQVPAMIVDFQQDRDGHLYVVDRSGSILRMGQ